MPNKPAKIANVATAINTAAVFVPRLRAASNCFISASSFVLTIKIPRSDKTTPIAAIKTGASTALSCIPSIDAYAEAPKAIVASIEPAYDSYKSAPIPATSPTLSPTLSAIVAGLRGSSSGMLYSVFPTKSAPTSAALV